MPNLKNSSRKTLSILVATTMLVSQFSYLTQQVSAAAPGVGAQAGTTVTIDKKMIGDFLTKTISAPEGQKFFIAAEGDNYRIILGAAPKDLQTAAGQLSNASCKVNLYYDVTSTVKYGANYAGSQGFVITEVSESLLSSANAKDIEQLQIIENGLGLDAKIIPFAGPNTVVRRSILPDEIANFSCPPPPQTCDVPAQEARQAKLLKKIEINAKTLPAFNEEISAAQNEISIQINNALHGLPSKGAILKANEKIVRELSARDLLLQETNGLLKRFKNEGGDICSIEQNSIMQELLKSLDNPAIQAELDWAKKNLENVKRGFSLDQEITNSATSIEQEEANSVRIVQDTRTNVGLRPGQGAGGEMMCKKKCCRSNELTWDNLNTFLDNWVNTPEGAAFLDDYQYRLSQPSGQAQMLTPEELKALQSLHAEEDLLGSIGHTDYCAEPTCSPEQDLFKEEQQKLYKQKVDEFTKQVREQLQPTALSQSDIDQILQKVRSDLAADVKDQQRLERSLRDAESTATKEKWTSRGAIAATLIVEAVSGITLAINFDTAERGQKDELDNMTKLTMSMEKKGREIYSELAKSCSEISPGKIVQDIAIYNDIIDRAQDSIIKAMKYNSEARSLSTSRVSLERADPTGILSLIRTLINLGPLQAKESPGITVRESVVPVLNLVSTYDALNAAKMNFAGALDIIMNKCTTPCGQAAGDCKDLGTSGNGIAELAVSAGGGEGFPSPPYTNAPTNINCYGWAKTQRFCKLNGTGACDENATTSVNNVQISGGPWHVQAGAPEFDWPAYSKNVSLGQVAARVSVKQVVPSGDSVERGTDIMISFTPQAQHFEPDNGPGLGVLAKGLSFSGVSIGDPAYRDWVRMMDCNDWGQCGVTDKITSSLKVDLKSALSQIPTDPNAPQEELHVRCTGGTPKSRILFNGQPICQLSKNDTNTANEISLPLFKDFSGSYAYPENISISQVVGSGVTKGPFPNVGVQNLCYTGDLRDYVGASDTWAGATSVSVPTNFTLEFRVVPAGSPLEKGEAPSGETAIDACGIQMQL